jgi:TRAP-type C4-dicarboxylate transport system permease large subunit
LGGTVGEWTPHPLHLVIGLSIIYIVLGKFLDPLGLLLPADVQGARLRRDLLGVIVVKCIEIRLLTQPVGFNAHLVKNVVGNTISLETIFRGEFLPNSMN